MKTNQTMPQLNFNSQTETLKMKAIIQDSCKQYRVAEGDIVEIDLRKAEDGSTLEFEQVLLVEGDEGAKVGAPFVDGAKVTAKVLGEAKGDRLVSLHYRRRKNSKCRTGHRQRYTKVQIEKIEG